MKVIKLFLRFTISAGFLSAVADRFGWWHDEVSVWGNWTKFLEYRQLINPCIPTSMIPVVGLAATAAEIVFALFLIIGFQTELFLQS